LSALLIEIRSLQPKSIGAISPRTNKDPALGNCPGGSLDIPTRVPIADLRGIMPESQLYGWEVPPPPPPLQAPNKIARIGSNSARYRTNLFLDIFQDKPTTEPKSPLIESMFNMRSPLL